MSVLEFEAGSMFTVITKSRIASSPEITWNNSYELWAQIDGDQAALAAFAGSVAAFQIALTLSTIELEEVRVSTWNPDSNPYDPTAFFVQPVNLTGTISATGVEPLPLTDVLFLKRQVSLGRLGKLFLRGALTKGDVTGTYRSWSLSSPGSIGTRVSDALTSSGLDAYLQGGESVNGLRLALLHPSGGGTTWRPVSDLTVGGVSSVKLNHKYFDKAP